MGNQDNFFTPEEVDRQIDQVGRLEEGERADAEAMAYLRSFYKINTQQEQGMLDRIWGRIADASPSLQQKQYKSGDITMQNQHGLLRNQAIGGGSSPLVQRMGVLAAVIFLAALVGSMALLFSSIHHNPGGPAAGGPKPTPIITTVPQKPTPSPTTKVVPFHVTSVDMAVTPTSIAGIPCGTNVTVTYKATIHVLAQGPGGTVQFSYTVNNGRGQSTASVQFAAGETSKTFSFTWSGALPPDHTYPGQGGISVTSPNQLTSSLIGPTGRCQ